MDKIEAENHKSKRIVKVREEVERLLACIKDKADHYSVLNIDRDATIEEIRKAYRQAVEHVHPLKCKDIIEADGAMRWKLSQALLRVVEAFSALAHPARKIEYDGELDRRPQVPIPIPPLPDDINQSAKIKGDHRTAASLPTGLIEAGPNRIGIGVAFGHSDPYAPEVKDRRRARRFALKLPVRITSQDGSWAEVTESLNVSRTGILFCISQPVQEGTPLQIEVQMPVALRTHSYDKVIYVVRAAVRHITPADEKSFKIGAEFIEHA
ncbi:MAG: DnaJ domain-containing protein [Blastocatellia bacterium]|nr:DnaJ domain-containing protein [Blastocatellia bacterium]